MTNYNDELLKEVKKLKEMSLSLGGISKAFETLETMANKHVEINTSFKENLEQLNDCNDEFSNLNDSIRSNILDLKETALKFPQQLVDLADKNKKYIEVAEEKIMKTISVTINEQSNYFNNKLNIVFEQFNLIKMIVILMLLINSVFIAYYLYAKYLL